MNELFIYLVGGALAFGLFYLLNPMASAVGLLDKPDQSRKLHSRPIPLIGGLMVLGPALFVSIGLGLINYRLDVIALVVCMALLVLVGTLDDFFEVHARPKLGLQFLISTVYVFYFMNVGVDFSGLFGLRELNEMWSKIFLSLMFVFLINAFNLIDGANTLLGVFMWMGFLFFIWFFWQIEDWNRYYLALAFGGAMMGFLWFNKTPAKVFMGDAGSLGIGFVLSDFMAQFLFFHHLVDENKVNFMKDYTPVLALALFALPVFDMLRVIVLRLLGGRLPMAPGRDHMHHYLLDKGWTHIQTSLALNGISLGLFLATAGMARAGWDINLVFAGVVVLAWLTFPGSGRAFLAARGLLPQRKS